MEDEQGRNPRHTWRQILLLRSGRDKKKKKKKASAFISMHNRGMWDGGKEYTQVRWRQGLRRCDTGFLTVDSWCSTVCRCGILHSAKHKDRGVYTSTGEEMGSIKVQLISSSASSTDKWYYSISSYQLGPQLESRNRANAPLKVA